MATTLNSAQFQYPESMDDQSVPSGVRMMFTEVHRLYGTNDIHRAFPSESGTSVAPWPTAGRQKNKPAWDQSRVTAELNRPPVLHDFDPRNLHATQPRVLEQHVRHYMSPQFGATGVTSADKDNVGNQYPFVYTDVRGRNLILAGHHRAMAALLQGRPLRARTTSEGTTP